MYSSRYKIHFRKRKIQNLQFLDLAITRIPANKLIFSVAHKPYSIINPINWVSNHPQAMKLRIKNFLLIVPSNSHLFLQIFGMKYAYNHLQKYPHTLINVLHNLLPSKLTTEIYNTVL